VGTEQDGILRSEDGGKTWASANPGLLDLTVLALACSPALQTDHTVFAATSSGLFWSRNTGRTWRSIDTLPGQPAVQCVALSPAFASDGVVLAGTEADGLFRSTDAGATWHSVEALMGRSVTALAWSASGSAAAATDAGVAVSHDAGASWRWVGSQGGPVLSVVFTPDGGLLAGVPRNGLMRSSDLMEWQSANAGLQANLVVALAITSNHTLYIGGLEDGIAASRDAGVSWESANEGLASQSAVFGLAAQSDQVYAATAAGVFKQFAGRWQQVHPGAARGMCAEERRIVAAGAGPELLVSEDAGIAWRTLDLPPEIGQPIAVGLAGPSTLIVGSSLGIWRSADGRTWQPIPAQLPGHVSVLVGSPTYRQDRIILAGTSAGVCISRDAGATFQSWSEGMGATPVVALAFSPTYASEREVYAVELGGRIWRRHDRPSG
ncbi:MAG: YCF48-related protein, partial [Chloroflexota bacterium]|nr:YCF48-related protein [Chloroflexota bacterium]